MPAAAVIPAPIAYIKFAAVKKLVVGRREWAGGPPRGELLPVPDPASRCPPDALGWVSGPQGSGAFTLKKSECSKRAPTRLNA